MKLTEAAQEGDVALGAAAQTVYALRTMQHARRPPSVRDYVYTGFAKFVKAAAIGEAHYVPDDMMPFLLEVAFDALEKLWHEVDSLKREHRAVGHPAAFASHPAFAPDTRKRGCHQCGADDHGIASCPEARRILEQGGELKVRCKHCKKRTHFAKDCTQPAASAGLPAAGK